jgi:cold shock CspA family protein
MPSGRVKWFDAATGEGRILSSGHEYPTRLKDCERAARVTGARVHFDLKRDEGAHRAVRVRLQQGTRTSRSQNRFGDLVGAHHPQSKGHLPLTHRHADRDIHRDLENHPIRVAEVWLGRLQEGDLGAAMRLYAPDARVQLVDKVLVGPHEIQGFLQASPLLGCRAESIRVRLRVPWVIVRCRLSDRSRSKVRALLRVHRGEIVEQLE